MGACSSWGAQARCGFGRVGLESPSSPSFWAGPRQSKDLQSPAGLRECCQVLARNTSRWLQAGDSPRPGCVTSAACCQVFLKPGVISRLEKQRDKLIAQKMILLQAACKGFLSRQKFKMLKVSVPQVADTLCPPKPGLWLLQWGIAAVIRPRASKSQLFEQSKCSFEGYPLCPAPVGSCKVPHCCPLWCRAPPPPHPIHPSAPAWFFPVGLVMAG